MRLIVHLHIILLPQGLEMHHCDVWGAVEYFFTVFHFFCLYSCDWSLFCYWYSVNHSHRRTASAAEYGTSKAVGFQRDCCRDFFVRVITHLILLFISIKWTACPCSCLRLTPHCAVFQTNCLQKPFHTAVGDTPQDTIICFSILQLQCTIFISVFLLTYKCNDRCRWTK